MNERPWPDPVDAVGLNPVGTNPEIEAVVRRALQQLNLLIEQFNSLLTMVRGNATDISTNAGDISTNADDIATKQDALTFQYSLTESTDVVNLTGDTETPGNSKVYGTDGGGDRGWYNPFPTGTAYELVTCDADGYPAGVPICRDLAGTADRITVSHSASTITLNLPDVIKVGAVQLGIGEVPGYLYPLANSTTAISIRKADGSTGVVIVDTTNARMGVNCTPSYTMDVDGTFRVTGTAQVDSVSIGVLENTYIAEIRKDVANDVGPVLHLKNSQYAGAAGATADILMSLAYDNRSARIRAIGTGSIGYIDRLSFGIHNNSVTFPELLTVKRGGNVGVNEPDPDSQLEINGTLHVTGALTFDTALTVLGTVGTGAWQGTAIADGYIASAAAWNAKAEVAIHTGSIERLEGSPDVLWLDNDENEPGNDKLYGTDGDGTKGWFDQPAAGDSFPGGTAYELLTWDDDASDVVSRNLAGTANQITVGNTASTITLSLPSPIQTPGSLGVGMAAVKTLDVNGTARVSGDTRINGDLGIGVDPTCALDVDGPIRMRS